MTRPAELAIVAACSRALGYLEALTEAETVKADTLIEELQAALEQARESGEVAK